LNIKRRILSTSELNSKTNDYLDKNYSYAKYGRAIGVKTGLTESQMIECMTKENPEILVLAADPVTEKVLASADHLKYIACTRSNPSNLDIEACHRKGIIITNTPGRNANAVAEYTLGLILCCARSIPQAHMSIKTGECTIEEDSNKASKKDVVWLHPSIKELPYLKFRGVEIENSILGIIGFGLIGQMVAEKAINLGMKVLIYDPYISKDFSEDHKYKRTDLNYLLRNSDFVSLHAKVTKETTKFIGMKEISLMKDTAYLINTARGALIDHKALYEALLKKKITGAALDVFEYEPLCNSDPLLQLDNLILTPHLGGASSDVVNHHSRMVLEDIIKYFKNEESVRHICSSSE